MSRFLKITQGVLLSLTTIWPVTTKGKLETVYFKSIYFYCKRRGTLRTALIYLEKALELEGFLEDSSFKADTHLNISAVLS